jgi:predicted nucleic acid-binding protein
VALDPCRASRSPATRKAIFPRFQFHWRAFLPDPDDDMILELAFAANCRYIVTHNIRDFRGCEKFGVEAVTPHDFLKIITESRKP